MRKNQKLDIIVRTLALPFTNFDFFSQDLFCKKAACLEKMQNGCKNRTLLKEEHLELQTKIMSHMASITQVERLDDISQLINMFYADTDLVPEIKSQGGSISIDSYYFKKLFAISRSLVTLRNGRIAIRMWVNDTKDELFNEFSGLSKLEIWSTLARIVTPDVFIAAYFVDARLDNINYLSNVSDNLFLCDIPLAKILEKGIAETHLHMNAGMSYLSLWENVSDFTRLNVPKSERKMKSEHFLKKEFRDFPTLFLAGLLRLLMADYMQKQESQSKFCDMLDFFKVRLSENSSLQKRRTQRIVQKALSIVMMEGHSEERKQTIVQLYQEFYKERSENISNFKKIYNIQDNDSVFDLLGRGVYQDYAHLNTSYEIIFLYKALSFIQKKADRPQFMHILLQYLRLKNDYFKDKMQSVRIKGLRYFQEFYNRASDAPYANSYGGNPIKEAIYLSIFKDQGKCLNLKKLELKISPKYPVQIVSLAKPDKLKLLEIKRSISKQLLEIFSAYLRYFNEVYSRYSNIMNKNTMMTSDELQENYLDELQERKAISFPTIGLVYHFIKWDDMDRYLGDNCWVSPPNVTNLSSNNTQMMRKRYMEFWDALNEMIRDIPFLGEYIVGIDAASDELSAEPWVFAPVYRYVRNRNNTYPVQLENNQRLQTIGLTYHVGEDYRHVLSGLRYIYEVLTYFGFKAGDRIGHALALQVNIRSWVITNEVIAMPVGEYLENLLWHWYLESQFPEIKNCSSLNLEKKIMDTAKKIYENITGLTPYVLWKAYTHKFEGLDNERIERMKKYYRLEESSQTLCQNQSQNQGPPLGRCFCKLYHERQVMKGFSDSIWDEEKLLLTHFCPIYVHHYSKPMFVRTSEDEIALLMKIQEHLKIKIQQAGIYVETNPTSNATIGDMDSLFEHPITTINSKELNNEVNSNVLLSINSDDPLVFNTIVENEIANVYHMLINQSYSREDILSWIDKVRQNGIDSSFVKLVKKPSLQMREIKTIINYLTVK